MRLPSPTLSADERAVLEAIATHGGPHYAEPVDELLDRIGLTTMELARLAWSLQDPRRFTADLLFVDERYNPPLVRLTPEALEAVAGDVPVEPKLTAAIAAGVTVRADPDAVDQLLFTRKPAPASPGAGTPDGGPAHGVPSPRDAHTCDVYDNGLGLPLQGHSQRPTPRPQQRQPEEA